MLKPLTVWITTSYGKFLKTTLPASWETCMKVKKQQLEPDMEAWAGSNLGKEDIYSQGCILSPCLFNLNAKYIMWNAILEEAQAGIKTAVEI